MHGDHHPVHLGLINDVVPKHVLGRFYGLLRIVSLGAGSLFNSAIFKLTEAHLREIFVGVGVFFGLGFMLMYLMVREGGYPDPAPEQGGKRPDGLAGAVRKLCRRVLFGCHYLRVITTLSLSVMTTGQFSVFNAYSQSYAHALGLPKTTLGNLTASSFAMSMVLAFFIGWIVDSTSPLKVSMVAIGVYACVTLAGYLQTVDAASFGRLYVSHILLGNLQHGSSVAADAAFPRMRFPQFACSGLLMTSVAGIVGNAAAGPILDRSGHDYSLTILASSLFAFLTLAALLKVKCNLLPARGRPARGRSPVRHEKSVCRRGAWPGAYLAHLIRSQPA